MDKPKLNIINHVDILDLIRIYVFRIANTGRFEVQFECLDETKEVVIDEDALKVMQEKVTEKASQFDAKDPRAKPYIEEFLGRLISELYRNGLVELQDMEESPDDPYGDLRKKYKNLN